MISCQAPATDVGKPCFLVKRGPPPPGSDGGYTTVRIKEGELPVGWDFISFGSAGCEDFVCIRDKNVARSGNPETEVQGYCSRPCAPSNPSGCAVSLEFQLQPIGTEDMTCRAMLLDDTTVTQFCEADPEGCRRLFGTNRSPYFCARGGGTSDGGTRTDGGTP
jgi:hypothetical protein